jgi:ribosomal subunit interface protein
MQTPLQISLHGIAHSEAISSAIREKAQKLERFYSHITSCHVVLELASGRERHGKQLTARIDIKVPGGEIVVTHQHDADLQVALRDAFDAARRKLEDYARTQRGDVKRHATP